MEQNYTVRLVYRGFEDPQIPKTPVEHVISVDSSPMDLPYCTSKGLVFALDGKEIPADQPFQENKIRENALLLIIKAKPNAPLPLDELNPRLLEKGSRGIDLDATLYGCPSASEVAGLVPESMVQPFQGFRAVEL